MFNFKRESDWHLEQYFPKSQRENRVKGFFIVTGFVGACIGLIYLVVYFMS